jgi:hypothetical protein
MIMNPFLYPAGTFFSNSMNATARSTAGQAAGRMTVSPMFCAVDQTIDQAGVSISTGVGSSLCRVVIYDTDSNGYPSTILAQTGDIDCASAVTVMESISFTFQKGKLYWVGTWTNSTQTLRTLGVGASYVLSITNASTPVVRLSLSRTVTYGGSAPDWTFNSSHLSTNAPAFVLFRAA